MIADSIRVVRTIRWTLPDTPRNVANKGSLRFLFFKKETKKMRDEFEKLWQVVDRKVNKQQAFKSFKKNYKELKTFAIKNKIEISEVYKIWKHLEYKSKDIYNEEGEIDKSKLQFVCHLSTWLNGWRWEDEIIIDEPEEDKWYSSYSGIISKGESLGIIFDEDKMTFPEYKKIIFSKVPKEG